LEKAVAWKNHILENSETEQYIPMLLCGNKSDLDHNLTEEQLTDFAKQHGFDGSIKTSAKTGDNTTLALSQLV
jgi:GTPase SAR1 family protein